MFAVLCKSPSPLLTRGAQGTRLRPPTALEMGAAFSKSFIAVDVQHYTGSHLVDVDAAATAREVMYKLTLEGVFTEEPGFGLAVCSADYKDVRTC